MGKVFQYLLYIELHSLPLLCSATPRIIFRYILQNNFCTGTALIKTQTCIWGQGRATFRAFMVLRFMYGDGGLYGAYRVLRLMYSDG